MKRPTNELAALHAEASSNYGQGERKPSQIVGLDGLRLLESIGIRDQILFDFAEDFVRYGEPGVEDFVNVIEIRRTNFLESLSGSWPAEVVAETEMPRKTDEWDGIAWLPRITTKAECFLEGSLPPDVMFGCGGDRRFLRERGLSLAGFLEAVRDARGDREAIIRYVR